MPICQAKEIRALFEWVDPNKAQLDVWGWAWSFTWRLNMGEQIRPHLDLR